MSDQQEPSGKAGKHKIERSHARKLEPGEKQYFWIYMLMIAALLSLVFLPRAAAGDGKLRTGMTSPAALSLGLQP